MLTNRIHGITKEDYERQEHEVSCMSNEQLALLLECITKFALVTISLMAQTKIWKIICYRRLCVEPLKLLRKQIASKLLRDKS